MADLSISEALKVLEGRGVKAPKTREWNALWGNMADPSTDVYAVTELLLALVAHDELLREACRKWAACCDDSVLYPPRIRNAGEGYRCLTEEATDAD